MVPMIRTRFATISTTIVLLAVAAGAHAAAAPHDACAAARIKAAAKYEGCQAKAMAKFETTKDFEGLRVASSKCQQKYASTWPKLQKKFTGSGTPCELSRLVDNGTTVTDNLTGLQWEKKLDDGSVHDKDNVYSWTWAGDLDDTNADGTAFDDFLWQVAGGCFAGHCDWRLPTRAELMTILSESYPCTTSPCLAATFGLAQSSFHITASTVASDFTNTGLWAVNFADGGQTQLAKTGSLPARAVRGGL